MRVKKNVHHLAQYSLELKRLFKKIKIYSIVCFIWVHDFVKNVDNIQKCLIIAASFFFLSSYIQIPDMKDQSILYVLDWLAYDKSNFFFFYC
jgi:hypothetical protein